MNGSQAVLRRRHRPHEAGRKNNHVSGPFLISTSVVAWKPNPWRSLRHSVDRMATTIHQKDESPSEGPRYRFQGQKPARASAGDDDGQRRINSVGGRFRRKSAKIRMRIRMHFRFSRAGGAPMPTGSRAGARFHRRPYAVVCTVCSSLKRKKAEKGPTPKRGA